MYQTIKMKFTQMGYAIAAYRKGWKMEDVTHESEVTQATPAPAPVERHEDMVAALSSMDDNQFAAAKKAVEVANELRTNSAPETHDSLLAIVEAEDKCLHVLPGGKSSWKRGMLPGSKLIKTCLLCGVHEVVDSMEEWNTIG